ncbi:MAG: CHAT domain-containing protein, partial [Cyclobacteriaceae bacterium]
MSNRPVFITAYANAKEADSLQNLQGEADAIQSAMNSDNFDRWCKRHHLGRINATGIIEAINDYRERIIGLHFAGHAGGIKLVVHGNDGEETTLDVSVMAELLKAKGTPIFVFLNGCATKPSVKYLLNEGILCVLATSSKVPDKKASEFAKYFYMELAKDCSLEKAFHNAKQSVNLEGDKLDIDLRSEFSLDSTDEEQEIPFQWGLYTRVSSYLKWKISDGYNLPKVDAIDLERAREVYINIHGRISDSSEAARTKVMQVSSVNEILQMLEDMDVDRFIKTLKEMKKSMKSGESKDLDGLSEKLENIKNCINKMPQGVIIDSSNNLKLIADLRTEIILKNRTKISGGNEEEDNIKWDACKLIGDYIGDFLKEQEIEVADLLEDESTNKIHVRLSFDKDKHDIENEKPLIFFPWEFVRAGEERDKPYWPAGHKKIVFSRSFGEKLERATTEKVKLRDPLQVWILDSTQRGIFASYFKSVADPPDKIDENSGHQGGENGAAKNATIKFKCIKPNLYRLNDELQKASDNGSPKPDIIHFIGDSSSIKREAPSGGHIREDSLGIYFRSEKKTRWFTEKEIEQNQHAFLGKIIKMTKLFIFQEWDCRAGEEYKSFELMTFLLAKYGLRSTCFLPYHRIQDDSESEEEFDIEEEIDSLTAPRKLHNLYKQLGKHETIGRSIQKLR